LQFIIDVSLVGLLRKRFTDVCFLSKAIHRRGDSEIVGGISEGGENVPDDQFRHLLVQLTC